MAAPMATACSGLIIGSILRSKKASTLCFTSGMRETPPVITTWSTWLSSVSQSKKLVSIVSMERVISSPHSASKSSRSTATLRSMAPLSESSMPWLWIVTRRSLLRRRLASSQRKIRRCHSTCRLRRSTLCFFSNSSAA